MKKDLLSLACEFGMSYALEFGYNGNRFKKLDLLQKTGVYWSSIIRVLKEKVSDTRFGRCNVDAGKQRCSFSKSKKSDAPTVRNHLVPQITLLGASIGKSF